MYSSWQDCIPDSLLLDIFTYLDVSSLGRVAQVCKTWLRVSKDELLWQGVARRSLKIKGSLSPGKSTWHDEVKRLIYHVPTVCVETIHGHTDEVLDVAFSHDGQYFCTCSRDAHIVMWQLKSGCKSEKVGDFDARHYLRWQLSQYSIFNPNDSLILNFGVKDFRDMPDADDDDDFEYMAGIGAVFTVPDLVLVSVVEMDPPTMFGAWLNDFTYISGLKGTYPDTFNIQAYKVNKKDEVHKCLRKDKQTPLHVLAGIYERNCDKLFTFVGSYNHLMNLLVANVPDPCESISATANCDNKLYDPHSNNDDLPSDIERSSQGSRSFQSQGECHRRKRSIEELEKRKVQITECSKDADSGHDIQSSSDSLDRLPLSHHDDKCDSCDTDNDRPSVNVRTPTCYRHSKDATDYTEQWSYSQNDANKAELAVNRKQCIAFVTGNHDRIAVHDVSSSAVCRRQGTVGDAVGVNEAGDGDPQRVNDIDFVFILKHCYITGLCLSHDHRYLYFNYRELDKTDPANQTDSVENLDELPTSMKVFCKQLKIGSIDLVTMTKTDDVQFSGHIGYSSWPAWYICLDASPDYIGSGSEDMRGYIWDRSYGVCVGILSHSSLDTGDDKFDVMSQLMDNGQSNVVNGIAFCPADQEICITACDDKLIKVWKSKHRVKNME